ncbi:MAG: hypothetical protein IKW44_05045 [Bacteroidaceae bacterium]|nr:hypothetical protein [Bacteroidaceae bacterium]
MRLIDADALFAEIENDYKNANGMRRRGLSEALDSIADATTIDAVPVVRCKDCKYRKLTGAAPFMYYCCNNNDGLVGGLRVDDFCSYGVRKDGDG